MSDLKAISEVGVFDLLEATAKALDASGQRGRSQALRAGFARATGGVDLPYIVQQLVAPEARL